MIRELGAATAFLYSFDRLIRRFNSKCGFYYYLFVAQPLADKPRLPPTRGKSFTFRLLQDYEPSLDGLDRPLAVIRQRFVQGAQCLLATKNEALVGCIWFVRDVYGEDEVRVDYLLPQDGQCVWDFDVFVTESERLGFLFAKQWDAFDALLKPQGIRYTVSRINAFNQRSIASHRALGAQDCGRALFLRLGWFQLMLSSRRPFFAFGGRPKLHVGPNVAQELGPNTPP
ncbi:hypothetical protein [Rhodoferax sp. PAMC 29310]|uniref:hypothetical protein n=1 Tax=Rhodoferax sp. PAMC 29310 TaxID=2822760 RepID=UPI001B33AE78|nr:hypothetical protein [Rhodoferax sp. PAMC 29310]